MQGYPIIAIIGRPNVGKSTLFNRLIGRREAITNHQAGTTRDRHFGVMRWFGHSWTVVDTAGVLFEQDEHENKELEKAMEEQVNLAVQEADIIALVVDIQHGLHADDTKLIRLLRKYNKPLVTLVNKADNLGLRLEAESFASLGVSDIFPVSAIHGSGMSEFVAYLQQQYPSPHGEIKDELPRITFIGRPNVGKSTLLNKMLGENRAVVSSAPGTTRDSIEAAVKLSDGSAFTLVDTAGIRRRGKIDTNIERFSLFRTLKAINQSDIVVLILTIEESPTRGDAHVATYALEAGKKVILALNKTDLARDKIFHFSQMQKRRIGERFLHRFVFLQRLPVYFISGQTGQGIDDLIKGVKVQINERQQKNEDPKPELS
jgi:GTPase